MRDLYGRRRVTAEELAQPTAMPVAPMPVPSPAPDVNMFAGAAPQPMPMQRQVFAPQIHQVARPNFSNIIEMLKRRRGM